MRYGAEILDESPDCVSLDDDTRLRSRCRAAQSLRYGIARDADLRRRFRAIVFGIRPSRRRCFALWCARFCTFELVQARFAQWCHRAIDAGQNLYAFYIDMGHGARRRTRRIARMPRRVRRVIEFYSVFTPIRRIS